MANNTNWFWTTQRAYGSYGNPTIYNLGASTTPALSGWSYHYVDYLGYVYSNYSKSSYCYLRFAYYWDVSNINQAKCKIRLELVERQHYLMVNSQYSVRLNFYTGYSKNAVCNYQDSITYTPSGLKISNVKHILDNYVNLINIPGYTYVNSGKYRNRTQQYVYYNGAGLNNPSSVCGPTLARTVDNHPNSGFSRNIANHVIILAEQEVTVGYNSSGIASLNVYYDCMLNYALIFSGGKRGIIQHKSSFTIKSPQRPVKITGVSVRSTNSVTLKPKTISLTGLTNNSTKYNLSVTETASKSKTFGVKVTDYVSQTLEQPFTISPSSNVEGTVSVSSNNTSVLSIDTTSVNIKNSNNRKFKYTCKKPGTAVVTISGNGKTAKETFTVKSDDTIVWSSSNSNVVSVVDGKVTANAGRSGKATITAKCKSNSAVSKTLNIESLLKPKSYSVIADKMSMYPGETVRFRGKVNPISTDASKSVSAVYRPIDWTILNNNVTDTHTIVGWEDVLKSGTNKSGNFEVNFKLNSDTNTKDHILFNMRSAAYDAPDEDWGDLVDLEANKRIIIETPKIYLNTNHINLSIGDTTIVFVTTTPSNGNFTLDYDKSCLQVTRDKNRLTIKALKLGNTALRVIGNMTILSYMKQPVATLSVKVTDVRISSLLLSYVSNANVRKYDKSINVNSFTLRDESNVAIPSTINAANDGKTGESQIVTVKDFGYREFSAKDTNLKYTPSDARCKIIITSSDTSIVDIDSSNKNFNSNGDKYLGGNINLIYKKPGTAIITAKDSVTGLNSSITVTVQSDYSVSWAATPTNIVKVTNINTTKSKLEALPNINGKANLFAKVGECTKSITFNNHRLVDSIDIKPKSNGYYIGEKPEVVITFKPYVKGNPSKSASSTIINGSTIDVKSVKQSLSTHKINNENPNPFTFNNLTINKSHDTDKYEIVVHCNNRSEIGTINKAVTASHNIKVLAPTISVDPDIVDVKVSKTATMKVTTLPKNMEWTIPKIINATYENKFTDGKVIFTGKDRYVKQTYTITSKAPIMESYMSKATTDFSLIVSDNNLLTITQPKDQEYSLLPNNIAFTNRTDINDYDTKYVKKDDFDYDSDKTINVNTIMSFAECEKKITINYTPKVCTDTLVVSSSDTEIVDIKDGYSKELRPDYNGKIIIVLICRKEGKSTITLQSKNIRSVNTKFNVNVISNKNITIKPEDTTRFKGTEVVKVNKELEKHNHRSTFELITQHFDGSTYLKAIPEANTKIFARLKFITRLTPSKLDLYITDDKRSIVREISSFAKDKINVTALMEPNNSNNSNLQINKKYRLINYSYMYYDNGIGKSITSSNEVFRKNNENKLTDNFVFTIPTNIKADSYTITAQSEKNKTLKPSVKINVVQPDINIEGQVIDSKGNKYVDVYLANINDTNSKLVSQKDLIVDVIPSTQPYKIEPNTKNVQDGYSCKQDTKDRSIVKVVATPIRNLKTNSKNSASAINSVYKNNKAPNVSGVSFNVEYNGIIQTGRTIPKVKVNVFTLQYFGIPEILNVNIDNEIHYYSDTPKIIFKLPEYNDLDNLDEIEIKFKNGTFKFSENPELFSIYYNGNTKGHSIISSAIVDFKDNKNSGYCVFSPSKIVSDGDVLITFKATKFDNIPDASKKIKVKKKSLPTLPNIGDKIRLDTIKPYLNAIKDVLLPYLGENSNTIDRFGIDFNNLNFIGSTEKNKETAIKAMPFFKMLFILNKYLMDLKNKATFTNNKSNITPSNLSFESVRNMYVKQSSLISWYETYVDASSIYFKNSDEYLYTEFKRLMNIDLYNDYKDRKDLDNSYPVMVDDSNDFVGDISYGFENKFKSTDLYSKYTISPLTEIIKALKQF